MVAIKNAKPLASWRQTEEKISLSTQFKKSSPQFAAIEQTSLVQVTGRNTRHGTWNRKNFTCRWIGHFRSVHLISVSGFRRCREAPSCEFKGVGPRNRLKLHQLMKRLYVYCSLLQKQSVRHGGPLTFDPLTVNSLHR